MYVPDPEQLFRRSIRHVVVLFIDGISIGLVIGAFVTDSLALWVMALVVFGVSGLVDWLYKV